MRILRVAITWLLIAGVSMPAVANERVEETPKASTVGLHASVAKVVEQAAQAEPRQSIPRGYLWTGTALFVGGMAAGLYGFLNNQNGSFPEFGEAEATDKKLGAAGLAAAFAGGTILFLGSRRAGQSPSVTFGPGRVAVSKHVAW
jgi:hypothetical protein